jgi:hypothetical protein
MTDSSRVLARHAEWQKRRIHLSWPEKIRLAEAVMSTSRQWNFRSQSHGTEIKRHDPDLNRKPGDSSKPGH